ncbi:hypothetical protein BLA24_31890 [Streptomyces cinnamoneus]|uniref:Uncharacterized protein n=1 Tax=Streptomyces cinnamoneus TaxID=53446 RepID=A0A2G1X9Y6_STRCJ|nr:DUF6193 family natural product biosynthesis protein [Streptomyces cinnamoneus]PHQ48054.1 hypothetical protein BLA24_31890 [Streptomyces cinnamoneus]PPT15680.1 hypothetical protein CYQ11_24945 [Streptomyces cinnamoneus]
MSDNNSTHEAVEIVAAAWQRVLAMDENLVDPKKTRLTYSYPELRVLYPLVSHGMLQLSRCTDFPWTADVPVIYRRVEGGYVVRRLDRPNGADDAIVGYTDTLEDAVALVAANLPPGCGPAIQGTPDDLD